MMTKEQQDAVALIVKHLTPLEGATITSIGVSVEDFNEGLSEDPWWVVYEIGESPDGVLLVQDATGLVYMIDQDGTTWVASWRATDV